MGVLAACLLMAASLVAACAPQASAPDADRPDPVAIVNGRVFDGTGSEVVANGVVVYEGDRITAVGTAAEVSLPRRGERIDAGGGLVMPGVIDNHVHLFPTFSMSMARGEDTLTPWLQAGVTTLVDTGSIRHTVRASRALAASMRHPPRVFLAGPILTVPGGYPTTRREADIEMVAWEVEGPEHAAAVVAELIDQEGAELIKVAIETGFQTDYDEAGWPTLSMDELRAIADAAHERGVMVRAHVTNPGELQAAMQAGLDVLAHTPIHPIPEDLLREAAGSGLIFLSTANIWGRSRGAPVAPNLFRYHQLGGIVALGTDVPYQPGMRMPVAEMKLLTDAGFTPAEVLVAATRNSAMAIGRLDDLGTLEAGKLADIIVVAGDPLARIEEMDNVTVVIRDGERIPLPESEGS